MDKRLERAGVDLLILVDVDRAPCVPIELELKSLAGSFSEAPLMNVSFTADLYDSPVQMMPSCDQTGVPGLVRLAHFHSSTTSGSACLMSSRILPNVSPRQSPSSAIRSSISSDADRPSVDPIPSSAPPSGSCRRQPGGISANCGASSPIWCQLAL